MAHTGTPAPTAAVAKAQRMLDQIKDGKTVFTKSAHGTWYVIGPAADIRPGADVTVTKADGTTKPVHVTTITSTGEKQDTAYAMATFTNATPARRDTRRDTYIASPGERAAWASGRRHGINGQIWD